MQQHAFSHSLQFAVNQIGYPTAEVGKRLVVFLAELNSVPLKDSVGDMKHFMRDCLMAKFRPVKK